MDFDDALDKVRRFHEHIGETVADSPCLLACNFVAARWLAMQIAELGRIASCGGANAGDRLLCRTALALEELAEWLTAHADGDLGAAADSWADRAYVLLGDAVAAGLPAAELFRAVHESNMSKVPSTRTGSGKAVKGHGYQPPDVRRAVDAAAPV